MVGVIAMLQRVCLVCRDSAQTVVSTQPCREFAGRCFRMPVGWLCISFFSVWMCFVDLTFTI